MKKPTDSRQFRLDARNAADIRKEIARLAASYTPEWHFDEEHPDIGSVIALLFAEQAEWSIHKYNRQMEQFRMDYMNMLRAARKPAHPAEACVVFEPAQSTSGGVHLKKGTKLSAGGEDKSIVFETAAGCYITAAGLTHCFQTEAETGVIAPVFGAFKRQDYFEADCPAGDEELCQAELFSYPEKGIEKNGLVIASRHIFDIENDKIYMKLIGKEDLAERIRQNEFRILYPAADGLWEAESVEVLSDTLIIGREEPAEPVLILEAAEPVKNHVILEEILVSSAGEAHGAQYAGDGITDFDAGRFALFGSTLQLFDECYIGDDSYFSKGNAVVRIHFKASFPVHTAGLVPSAKETDLRLIKRKTPQHIEQSPADTCVEEIALEYFNGTGWKRLVCETDCTRMFEAGTPGDYEIRFLCPPDWTPTQTGSYEGRCMRIRLMKADNCYMTPCNHTYPVIEHLEISYSYEGRYERPEYLECLWGAERKNLTEDFLRRKAVTAFCPSVHEENALYFGFERRFEAGPVTMYFEFDHNSGFEGMQLSAEYSTRHGFRKMKVLDGTDGFSHTGILCFMPPEDFEEAACGGIKRYWLRMTDQNGRIKKDTVYHPLLKRVCLNGVQVHNIEEGEEQEFYIEQILPEMSFKLAGENILDADIWVNERDCCSTERMRELMEGCPEKVRAEYDMNGNIQDFYVKWEEVEDFENSEPDDRHYILDRACNEVRFGDGVHVKLPGVTNRVSFLATVRTCDGRKGNVGQGEITDFVSNIRFHGDFYNPLPAFGGTDQESLHASLQRGAGLMSSRRRLLTKMDYVREVKAGSENIDKVSCIVGETPEGTVSPEHICLVVLMKDFMDGSRSFVREAAGIREHLYSQCEMTIEKEKLSVVQPVPVEISVELWIKSTGQEETFEIQNKLTKVIENFLNPVSNESGPGWEIGALPDSPQILMRLHAAVRDVRIKNIMVTGSYPEKSGICERELDKLPKSPFFICKSGRHKIHILT